MKNLKDIVTTICGIIILAAGSVITMTQAGIILPAQVVTLSTAAGILAAAVLSYFTGKNPDGSTKTASQIDSQMAPKSDTPK